MSNRKDAYLGDRISQGCQIEHIAVAETTGPDIANTGGILIDVHKIPDKEPNWDAIHNHDLQLLAQRIVSLEKKVGELGYDSTSQTGYKSVPKTNTNPKYLVSNSVPKNRYLDVGENGATVRKYIGGNSNSEQAWHFISAGTTHSETIALLDRALYELTVRLGAKVPTPTNPGSNGATFAGTHADAGVIDGVGIGATITAPLIIGRSDTITEAIAKIESFLNQLQKEKIPSHASTGYNDAETFWNGNVSPSKIWSSEYTQAQIQRLIENGTNDNHYHPNYSGMTAQEKYLDVSMCKDYKVWSSARVGYEFNALWKKTRDAIKRLIDSGGGGGGGVNTDPQDSRQLISSSFGLSLNAETNGRVVTQDIMKTICPSITPQERDKRVIVLDVSRRPVIVGYWARWVWAICSGRITSTLIDELYSRGGCDGDSTGNVDGPTGGTATKSFWIDPSQAYKSAFTGSHAHAYMNNISWADFQIKFKASGTTATSSVYKAWWDETALVTMIDSVNAGGVAAGDVDKSYWVGTNDPEGQAGRKWGGVSAKNGSTYSGDMPNVTFTTAQITDDIANRLPPVAKSTAALSWNPQSRTWVHKSQDGSVGTTGTTYIPGGQISYSLNIDIAGVTYTKPFVVHNSPLQILFFIDRGYGMTGVTYTEAQMSSYILDGTALPPLTPVPDALGAGFNIE